MINYVSSAGSIFTSVSSDGAYIPDSGVTRYNSISRKLEALQSGGNWLPIPTDHAMVGLTAAAESAIQWAIAKQAEDNALSALCAAHPGLKDAKEKFDIMRTLVSQQ